MGSDALMLVSQDCWEDSAAESVHLSLGAAARCAEHRQSFENARLSHSSWEGTSPYLQQSEELLLLALFYITKEGFSCGEELYLSPDNYNHHNTIYN